MPFNRPDEFDLCEIAVNKLKANPKYDVEKHNATI